MPTSQANSGSAGHVPSSGARGGSGTLARGAVLLILLVIVTGAAAAQRGWLELETKHFRFIYRPGDGSAAVEQLLPMSDGIYLRVRDRFGYDVPQATVIVYDETDFANGYYSLAPPQHIGLFTVEPWVQLVGSDGSSWLEMLLVHELTHYFQYNTPAGLAYLAGRVFGPALGPFHHLLAAVWTVEGNAVNNESDLTDGGRLQDPWFLAQYRAQLYADAVPGLFQLGYDSHLPPRGRYYLGGAVFFDYLLREYGAQVLSDFHFRFARFPLGGVWFPLRAALGDPVREAYSDMLAADTLRFGLDPVVERAQRLTPTRSGTWSRPRSTGNGIYVYRRSVDRAPGIVRLDPATGEAEPVWSLVLTHAEAWSVSADGTRIVAGAATLEGSGAGLDSGERAAIVLWDDRTGDVRTLIADDVWSPAISPNGQTVVAVMRRPGNQQALIQVPADGGPEPEIIGMSPGMTFFDPVFTQDGQSVLVTTNQDGVQTIRRFTVGIGSAAAPSTPSAGEVLVAGGSLPDGTVLSGLARPHLGPAGEVRFVAAAGPAGSALNTPLSVWELDPGTRTASLVAWDPVAAVSRTDVDGVTLVQTMSELGTELRVQRRVPAVTSAVPRSLVLSTDPSNQEAWPASPPEPATADPGASSSGPVPKDARPYRPLPRPRLWLPDGGSSAAALASGLHPLQSLGAGVFVLGADEFGLTSWQASGVYYPGIAQPALSLSLDFLPPGWSFSLASVGDYVPVQGGFAWISEHSTRVGVDLLRRADHRQSRVIGANLGLSLARERRSDTGFTFAEVGTVGPGPWSLLPSLGIGGVRTSPAPRVAASGHLDRSASLTVSLSDLLAGGGLGPGVVDGAARLDLAPGAGRHTVRLAASADYGFGGLLVAGSGFRGFGSAVPLGPALLSPGQFGLSLDWILPAWLVDIPVAPSTGITAFSAGAFVEARGGFGSAGLQLEPDMVVGLELGSVITSILQLPLSGGVSVLIRPSAPEPLQAFTVYFGTGNTGLILETGARGSTISTPAGRLARRLFRRD